MIMTSTYLPPALFVELKFLCLKWSLLRPVSKFHVLNIERDTPVWTQLLGTGDQPDHPLASQSATDPPRHHMTVVLDPMESWEYWFDAEAMENRPRPFVIDNEKGEMITFGQFVTQIHAYAIYMHDTFNWPDTAAHWERVVGWVKHWQSAGG